MVDYPMPFFSLSTALDLGHLFDIQVDSDPLKDMKCVGDAGVALRL